MFRIIRYIILTLTLSFYGISLSQELQFIPDSTMELNANVDTINTNDTQASEDMRRESQSEEVLVSINSKPTGADVFIQADNNSDYMGETPLEFKVSGNILFTVAISKQGYSTWTREIRFDEEPVITAKLAGGGQKGPWIVGSMATIGAIIAVGGGISAFFSNEGLEPSSSASWPKPPGRP